MTEATPGSVFGNNDPLPDPAHDDGLPPRVIDRLGEWDVVGMRSGGMGRIYICVPPGAPSAGFAMALKSFAPEMFDQPSFRRAFLREAAVGLQLSSIPGVWPTYDIEFVSGQPFIVMPAVPPRPDGIVNLRDVLNRGLHDPREMLFLGWSIATTMTEALATMPRLIHGDLKPENILMWESVPYVADFGLAHARDSLRSGERLAATTKYGVPAGLDPHGHAADIYAFGVMLNELIDAAVATARLADETDDGLVGAVRRVATQCLEAAGGTDGWDFERTALALSALVPSDWGPLARAVNRRRAVVETGPFSSALNRGRVMESLLRLRENEVVLQIVDQIPEQTRDSQLWHWRGAALAATDHDDPAVESFQRALALLDEDDPATWAIKLDLASSLVHLGRHEECWSELIWLIAMAGENQLHVAVHNLASLYLAMGHARIAERLLTLVLSRIGTRPRDRALVLLSDVEKAMGRPDRAAHRLRDAIAENPYSAEYYERLGAVLIHDLEQFAAAGAAFDIAMESGASSAHLIVYRLACALLVRDEPATDAMIARAADEHGPDLVATVWRDALRHAALFARRSPKNDLEIEAELEADELADIQAVLDEEQTAEVTFKDSRLYDERVADIMSGNGDDPDMRVAASESGLLYDFYWAFSHSGYPTVFEAHHRLAEFVYAAEVGVRMRDTPPVPGRCDICAVEFVTNRTVGESFVCARCGRRTQLRLADDPAVDRLLAEIRPNGTEASSADVFDDWQSLIIVQPQEPLPREIAATITAGMYLYGFRRLPPIHPGVLYCISRGVEAGSFRPELPVLAAICDLPPAAEQDYAAATPPTIDRFAGSVREAAYPVTVNSTSMQYRRSAGGIRGLLIQGKLLEVEEELERREPEPHDAGIWAQLAEIALLEGDTVNARRRVSRALDLNPRSAAIWHIVATLRVQLGDAPAAIDAAHRAIRLGGRRSAIYPLLAVCHEQLGQRDVAYAMAQRAIALMHGTLGPPDADTTPERADSGIWFADEPVYVATPPLRFSADERRVLRACSLFEQNVNVEALVFMGIEHNPDAVPELTGMDRDGLTDLLRRAAGGGLLAALNDGGYFLILPAGRRYFDRIATYRPDDRDRAERSFARAMADFGNYLHEVYNSGHPEIVEVIAGEELNLLHGRALAIRHRLWTEAIGCMQGLLEYYANINVFRWTQLVSELIPHLVDAATDGPLEGLEQEWSLLTQYRVDLAFAHHDLPLAYQLQTRRTGWSRRAADLTSDDIGPIIARDPASVDEMRRGHLSNYAAALIQLGDVQAVLNDDGCVANYTIARELYQWLGDRRSEGTACHQLASAHTDVVSLRNLDMAETWYRRRLELSEKHDRIAIAQATGGLARVALLRFYDGLRDGQAPEELAGHLNEAGSKYAHALSIVPDEADAIRAVLHEGLAAAWHAAGNEERAQWNFERALEHRVTLGDAAGVQRLRARIAEMGSESPD